MKANHKVPEVLAGDHAIGVLTDEDKVRFEGPAGTRTGQIEFRIYSTKRKMELSRSALRAC